MGAGRHDADDAAASRDPRGGRTRNACYIHDQTGANANGVRGRQHRRTRGRDLLRLGGAAGRSRGTAGRRAPPLHGAQCVRHSSQAVGMSTHFVVISFHVRSSIYCCA